MRIGIALLFFSLSLGALGQKATPRELGIVIGSMSPGSFNAITDVEGVRVGQVTNIEGASVRTGVTAILPHPGNVFQDKVPAAIYLGNGFGKLAGYSQVRELGNMETPILLTNTLSVPIAADALMDYTLAQPGNEEVRSVNPVVGETNDGYLNDIRNRGISKKDVLFAIAMAKSGPVVQGNVGAGTGTICFGYKGGIGTSSRVLPGKLGGYTVGVLVQTNFGGELTISGMPNQQLKNLADTGTLQGSNPNPGMNSGDGSCMIVVATDAPLTSRNLERLAKRALLGLGRAGGNMSNGSGDYVIAFSTAVELRIPYRSPHRYRTTRNSGMRP